MKKKGNCFQNFKDKKKEKKKLQQKLNLTFI